MSFPTSPFDGQTTTVNNTAYRYSTILQAWTRVAGSISVTGTTSTFFINNGTASISTDTGALVVTGGVGIGGDINFSGNLYQNGVLFTGGGGGSSTSFKFITVTGQSSLTAQLADTLQLVAGSNIQITTDATPGQQSITVSTSIPIIPLKTFNIIGDFGVLTGVARYIPIAQDTIRSIIVTVVVAYQDVILGLYRNGEFVSFYTVPAGQQSAVFKNLNITILPSEFYTINVVAGAGTTCSVALFNTSN